MTPAEFDTAKFQHAAAVVGVPPKQLSSLAEARIVESQQLRGKHVVWCLFGGLRFPRMLNSASRSCRAEWRSLGTRFRRHDRRPGIILKWNVM